MQRERPLADTHAAGIESQILHRTRCAAQREVTLQQPRLRVRAYDLLRRESAKVQAAAFVQNTFGLRHRLQKSCHGIAVQRLTRN